MTAKLTDRERRELFSATPLDIATDALADVVFSLILEREAELIGQVLAGVPMEKELAAVQALLRLIFSSDVRMPLSRLQ